MHTLLVMTARLFGGAEAYVEHLVTELTAKEGRCRFTVAMSDAPELQPLAERLGRIASVQTFAFDRTARLPGIVRELQRLATQHDLVHLNSNHPGSRLGILMGFVLPAAGRPVVCVEAGATRMSAIQVPRAIGWSLPTLFRWSRRRVARVVAVSEENRRTLEEYYRLPPDRIEVVYNGVDLDRFAQRSADPAAIRRGLNLRPDQPVILVLARLAPGKGHKYLVEAAPAILARFPKATFVFAGAPDERVPLDQQIAAGGLGDHFSILGFRSDTVELLRASDLFVLPSLAEGFSLAIIEALAAGLPVVATRVGGAAEIIFDGNNGFLVPPADADALARAVIQALGMDAASRDRIKQGALDTAQRFSFTVTAQQMLALYRDVGARES